MYLKKIKLAGFKSFVDPTSILFQSKLTGVVGPNGCGKSNIIDAVRWVMGEISAKQLRGQSMSDVIFNGSSTRKQVGQAAVELIFDNSDASLGGEYAKYNEIAIRREVTRDGTSDYFFNNARCRRKDITDIFLGTGLGPRSYAIIEQGTVSQLIDAKPDELRVFIEEAAGISKYKERRRETENRIKHTKENLNRLNDIREELEKQLRHLRSQANAANRYKKLKQEERQTKAELCSLHYQSIAKTVAELAAMIETQESLLENKIGAQHALEAKMAELRENHHLETEQFNTIQTEYYKIGANIGRLEQQIQHNKDRHSQLQKDLEQITEVWQETLQHQNNDQAKIELLVAERDKIQESVKVSQDKVQKSKAALTHAQNAMQKWQEHSDAFNAEAAQNLQRLEVSQTSIAHLESSISQETEALEKLQLELQTLDFVALGDEVMSLHNQFLAIKAKHENLQSSVVEKQQHIIAQREKNNNLAAELDAARSRLQSLSGRVSSLEALQQTALGKNDTNLVTWLEQFKLNDKQRLLQKMTVTPGWEVAVETVLGNFLEAVCVDDLPSTISALESFSQGNLILFAANNEAQNLSLTNTGTLAEKVTATIVIGHLLEGVYVAENLNAALAIQAKLNANESVITKDGIWLGPSWVKISRAANPKAGVLQRERELNELIDAIKAEKAECAQKENLLLQEQNALAELEHSYHLLQDELHQSATEHSAMQGQLSAKEARQQHLGEREQVVKQEIVRYSELLQKAREQLEAVKQVWQEANAQKDSDAKVREDLVATRLQLQQQLQDAQVLEAKDREEHDNFVMRLELTQTEHGYLLQSIERAKQRIDGLVKQQQNIQQALAEAQNPNIALTEELQQELANRLTTESELTKAKEAVANIDQEIVGIEKQRSTTLEEVEYIRAELEKYRTEREGLQVRASTYVEQIKEQELTLDSVIAALAENATIEEWEQKLAHYVARIERLGPINLAAIAEVEKLEERRNYLDAQNQDLVSALNTLEGAIHRIDHDTRDRFKITFDQINTHLQNLFPKIFNGGKSSLELTTDNLLETGVVIMAQPPGKRNSSIHLLSGGEKALTAIALIFSIFQLNPAPFCMLDEVDAPLDDLNVTRFCNLVKEMAKTIQFIFVTHNKLTMEIANQLAGVTMQEAGVSRIVSVNLDAAIQMAN
ncbi:MAG: chromosome segregation protein SMC [Gammaproteobacteria bacterium]|nr:chromosome segregation protein SMC [Gammaproteobacteria bacterium]